MKAHCGSSNHHLLINWICRHLKKNPPFHLPYTKCALYYIAKT
jgi:hypothetical protein